MKSLYVGLSISEELSKAMDLKCKELGIDGDELVLLALQQLLGVK